MAKRGNAGSLIAAWAFLIGVILAVILGLFQSSLNNSTWIYTVLVVVGLVVGLFNIGVKESGGFLLASVALVIVSFMGAAALSIIPWVEGILSALLVMFVPATVIVALKQVFAMAKA